MNLENRGAEGYLWTSGGLLGSGSRGKRPHLPSKECSVPWSEGTGSIP